LGVRPWAATIFWRSAASWSISGGGAHEVVVSARDVADFGEGLVPALSEVKRVETAVFWVLRACNELAGFESVDDGDEAAGVQA
jgi:hypothetical protein